jgi:hypothetical protein
MTPQQISTDIERGLILRDTIKTILAELKQIENRLEQAGLTGEQIPLQEADREGRQFLAKSEKLGLVIPVIFESDQIVASIQPDTEVYHDLAKLSEGFFPKFWKASSKLDRIQKDGQTYRKTARELLGSAAPDFIAASLQRDKAGIPKSRTIIAWDHAKSLSHLTTP